MKSPAFRFFPADFWGSPDVQAMELHEVGAYLSLLSVAWQSERHGFLKDDDKLLRRWARMSLEQWEESRDILLKKFPVVEDGWRSNPRMVDEAAKQSTYAESQKRKADLRWGNVKPEQSQDDAGASSGASKSDAGAIPSVSVSVSVEKTTTGEGAQAQVVNSGGDGEQGSLLGPSLVRTEVLAEDEIEEIRLAYPRKKKPEDARKAIRAAHAKLVAGKVTLADGNKVPRMSSVNAKGYLLERTKLFAASLDGRKEERYISYPASWFNAGSYTENEGSWGVSPTDDPSKSSNAPPPMSTADRSRQQRGVA